MRYTVIYTSQKDDKMTYVDAEEFDSFSEAVKRYALMTGALHGCVMMIDNEIDVILREFHCGKTLNFSVK